MNRGLIIAGFALLSVVALVGWTRTTGVQPQAAIPGSPVMYGQPLQPYAQQYSPYAQPYAYVPAPYGTPVMYATVPTPVQPRAQYAYNGNPAPVRRVVSTRRYYEPVRTVRRGRPLSHSIAIVAGSSGVGAAVGALAGGGKGAAIGALAGGAGGFIYDRLTHNR